MRRKLLQFQSFLAQKALRAAPKPRPQPQPHHRLLHSPNPSAPAPAPTSLLTHILWGRHPGTDTAVASFLPTGAAEAARTAASRWLAAARGVGSLDLFSLQRRQRSFEPGCQFSSTTFLLGAPWAHWMGSADGVVWTLIGANVAVFMLWRVADPGFMTRHFMISLDNINSRRFHTLLTSAFSHLEFDHLMTNMIGLYFFGKAIASTFGPGFMLSLYAYGALTGSLFFLLEKVYIAPRRQGYVSWSTSRASGLGASGAVNATILLQIFLYPKGLVYLYFLFPVPAALVGVGLIGSDLWRVKKGQGKVSGSAHLGGALVAAIMWAGIRNGWL